MHASFQAILAQRFETHPRLTSLLALFVAFDVVLVKVLDYKRFSLMVEAGAGTVSDIVWQLWLERDITRW